MPSIQKETSVAANSVITNENLWAGSAFEFAQMNGLLSIGLVGSATGLVSTVQCGSRVLLEESPLMVLTTMPIIPDHFYYNDAVLQGERIVCRVRNTTGGALTVRGIAQIQPA